jgi:tRNA U34 5-methylaminomethyl-2-thiouridine-forming methyltransferase MnmC
MNSTKAQKADLEWQENGVPVSTRFADPYFSANDGLAESQHVFLGGNNLPARFCEGFHIAELGFGSGLNLLAAWKAWEDAGFRSPLRFTSFEAYPMDPEQMARALANWPELGVYSERLLAGGMQLRSETLELNVIIGDARETLPEWSGAADAWFLDGFSPARNPELWSRELMQAVSDHTTPNGSFATYTAAGRVRRALTDAGFDVSRPKGHGTKRHMSAGVLK